MIVSVIFAIVCMRKKSKFREPDVNFYQKDESLNLHLTDQLSLSTDSSNEDILPTELKGDIMSSLGNI